MNRYLKAFIAVSVLLNLLLAGIVIGDAGRYFMGKDKHLTIQELTKVLSADKREHFKDFTTHTDHDLSALWQQYNDARKKAADVLKAEPFDKAAYLTQIEKIRQLKEQIRQHMANAVVDLAAQADPQERAAMADILFQMK